MLGDIDQRHGKIARSVQDGKSERADQYDVAGVTYECAQDVTMLAEHVQNIRTDLPIQVRYAPHNPANSIVVAETWSGLRLNSSRPYLAD